MIADSTSLLAQAFARLNATDSTLTGDIGTLDDGWTLATALMQDDAPLLDAALAAQAGDHPTMDARTRGSYFIGQYAWYVPAAAIAAYLIAGCAPELSPDNVALRYETYTWQHGDASGVAQRLRVRFLSSRCARVAGAFGALDAAALALPNRHALRDWLRCGLEAHLAPLIEQVYARTRLGRHAQWCLVADACASLFLQAGKALGNVERAQAEGRAFVQAAGSPMQSVKGDYITIQLGEHCETFRARGGCCRYYTVAPNGEKCSTCVLRPAAERDQLLMAYMARQYAQPSP